jgi:hypothetical protein
VIFVKYQIPKFAVFRHSDCPTCFALLLNKYIYQYISEEEYKTKLKKAKLKEKYIVKLLDILFKRLMNYLNNKFDFVSNKFFYLK